MDVFPVLVSPNKIILKVLLPIVELVIDIFQSENFLIKLWIL
jgi:hypothetical protein